MLIYLYEDSLAEEPVLRNCKNYVANWFHVSILLCAHASEVCAIRNTQYASRITEYAIRNAHLNRATAFFASVLQTSQVNGGTPCVTNDAILIMA
jgi:hypothetical protein